MPVAPDQLASLPEYFGRRLDADVRLVAWEIASHGYSDETAVVTLDVVGGETRRLVVRRHQPGGLLREETDHERHYRVLAALQATGIPVPRVLWFEEDESILDGAFFVMEAVAGFVPVPWSSEGRAFLANAGRGPIGRQFVEILAEIHALDWAAHGLAFLSIPPPGRGFALDRVEGLESLVERYGNEPEPILYDALGWLRANAPPAEAVALVHGDYRTGNLIYQGDRIAAVVDWEFCCLGDPMADVAWVLAPSNRTESELACFLLPPERFLDLYRDMTGRRPDTGVLHFWQVYHQVRHTVVWLSGAAHYAEGRTRDLRLARMSFALPKMRKMVADLLGYA